MISEDRLKPMARLTFISPDFTGQTCELPDGETPVGRSKAAGLVIEHASVSADHCKILVHGPEVIVQEHQSKNGLWVDGLRISGQTQVKHGQTIRSQVQFWALFSFSRIEGQRFSLLRFQDLNE